jgi:hypothetical protein
MTSIRPTRHRLFTHHHPRLIGWRRNAKSANVVSAAPRSRSHDPPASVKERLSVCTNVTASCLRGQGMPIRGAVNSLAGLSSLDTHRQQPNRTRTHIKGGCTHHVEHPRSRPDPRSQTNPRANTIDRAKDQGGTRSRRATHASNVAGSGVVPMCSPGATQPARHRRSLHDVLTTSIPMTSIIRGRSIDTPVLQHALARSITTGGSSTSPTSSPGSSSREAPQSRDL